MSVDFFLPFVKIICLLFESIYKSRLVRICHISGFLLYKYNVHVKSTNGELYESAHLVCIVSIVFQMPMVF